jgi:hypothetical protein
MSSSTLDCANAIIGVAITIKSKKHRNDTLISFAHASSEHETRPADPEPVQQL